MFELCLVVILYGTSLKGSSTLNSLADILAGGDYKGLKLIIWNNGPLPIERKEVSDFESILKHGVYFEYIETISNMPLGRIYNIIISKNPSKKYFILDGDSVVTKNYFNEAYLYHVEGLLVPRIEVQGGVHGPIFNGKIVEKEATFALNGKYNFFAISSGLVISRSLIDRFLKIFPDVFDERYALYGVDTSFYLRLKSVTADQPVKVMCLSKIHHSLSRLEKESERTMIFRGKERALDLGITLRHYFEPRWLVMLVKSMVGKFRGRSKFSITWFLYGFIVGRHPRANINESDHLLR